MNAARQLLGGRDAFLVRFRLFQTHPSAPRAWSLSESIGNTRSSSLWIGSSA
jgi:hypothetical protein